jgi:hypothetical protein
VSTQQGSSFNLMKASAKRRRSKKQIEKEKQDEEARVRDINAKLANYEQMEQEVALLQQDQSRVNNVSEAVEKLKSYGFVK